jgi:hypothetical protein
MPVPADTRMWVNLISTKMSDSWYQHAMGCGYKGRVGVIVIKLKTIKPSVKLQIVKKDLEWIRF